METLFEAETNAEVLAHQVRYEVEKHHQSWNDFIEQFGEHTSYASDDVLAWLGY